MRTKLIRIGNSQGVCLPKAVVEQAGLGKELELEVHDDRVVIQVAREARRDWDAAAAACHAAADDQLPDWDGVSGDGDEV